MAKASEQGRMRNRGLLTKKDRALLRGDSDIENPEERLADVRYNIRQRMEHIEEDLELLKDSSEEDLVAEFYNKFTRASQLERRIEELEERLEDE